MDNHKADDNYTNYMIETELVARGRRHFPDGIFISRSKIDSKFYVSTSYARNPNIPNSYICYYVNSEKKFGQIHYFVIMGELSFRSGEKHASITKVDVIKPIGPYPMFYLPIPSVFHTNGSPLLHSRNLWVLWSPVNKIVVPLLQKVSLIYYNRPWYFAKFPSFLISSNSILFWWCNKAKITWKLSGSLNSAHCRLKIYLYCYGNSRWGTLIKTSFYD